MRIDSMAASVSVTTSELGARASARAVPAKSGAVRRRISPQSGRALEILGHAIEYLTDEYVHESIQAGRTVCAQDAQVQAVQLLMKLNRQIYLDCPVVPSFGERCRALLQLGAA
jgi:hypothetical protein